MAGPETRIIPGHGELSSRDGVIAFRDMILTVAGRVSALVAEGKRYDEVVAADPTAEFNARYGSPDRFLTALYEQLGGAQ